MWPAHNAFSNGPIIRAICGESALMALKLLAAVVQKHSETVLTLQLHRTPAAYHHYLLVKTIHTYYITKICAHQKITMFSHWLYGKFECTWISIKRYLYSFFFHFDFSDQTCTASRAYSIIPGMRQWCQNNCLRYPPNCPESFCKCP